MFNVTFKIKILMSFTTKKHNKKKEKPKGQKSPHRKALFLEFIDNEMKHIRLKCKPSTCDNYMTARRSLSLFMRGYDIAISDLSGQVVEQYAKWLESRGVCINTISCYMRSLRSMYNRAVKRHRIRHCNPFGNVFTGNVVTRKRALNKNDIRILQQSNLPHGTITEICRDLFLFCFYAMGMPFIDAVSLKKTQINGEMMTYRRAKTGRLVKVRLEPCMKHIIKKYSRNDCEYVFPFLTGQGIMSNSRYSTLLKRYNGGLKQLAKKTKIQVPLTSYVPRHTWASMAYRENVPLHIISQALGHSTPRTTLIYIKELDNGILAKANRKVIKETIGDTSVQ